MTLQGDFRSKTSVSEPALPLYYTFCVCPTFKAFIPQLAIEKGKNQLCVHYVHARTYLAVLPEHNVIRMPVPNPEHVRGYAATSTRVRKVFHSLIQCCLLRILVLEPVVEKLLVKGSLGTSLLLDLGNGGGIEDHLDQTHLVSRGEAAVGGHPAQSAKKCLIPDYKGGPADGEPLPNHPLKQRIPLDRQTNLLCTS